MRNKADKAIPLELVPIKRLETNPEIFLAYVMFGVESGSMPELRTADRLE